MKSYSVATSSRRLTSQLKLLVMDQGITHSRVENLPWFLEKGDVLVLNDAATLPANLNAELERTGEKAEIRLVENLSREANSRAWRAVVFGQGSWRTPTELRLAPPRIFRGDRFVFRPEPVQSLHSRWSAQVIHLSDISERLVDIQFDSRFDFLDQVYRFGRPVQYSYLREPLEIWDQQTLASGPAVAVEAPSASFCLTWELLGRLQSMGVEIAAITHSTGISSTGDRRIDSRLPFQEAYHVPSVSAEKIERALREGRRIVAVGTGVTRALESAFFRGKVRSGWSQTSLRISAKYRRQVVTGILTGLHELESSHLELLESFVNRSLLQAAYDEAQSMNYLWHEYGDVNLILGSRVATG